MGPSCGTRFRGTLAYECWSGLVIIVHRDALEMWMGLVHVKKLWVTAESPPREGSKGPQVSDGMPSPFQ